MRMMEVFVAEAIREAVEMGFAAGIEFGLRRPQHTDEWQKQRKADIAIWALERTVERLGIKSSPGASDEALAEGKDL